jgi:hypothetical protein
MGLPLDPATGDIRVKVSGDGGGGAGTEYTEGDVVAAHTALVVVMTVSIRWIEL